MLCMLILSMSDGTYNLKYAPNNRFYRNFSLQICFCWKIAEMISVTTDKFGYILYSAVVLLPLDLLDLLEYEMY